MLKLKKYLTSYFFVSTKLNTRFKYFFKIFILRNFQARREQT
jgi:hypothetical protein